MLNWLFKDKTKTDLSYELEDKIAGQPTPTVQPLPEKDPNTYYSIGLTEDNRISVSFGTYPYVKTLFMSKAGAKDFISILSAAMLALDTLEEKPDEIPDQLEHDTEEPEDGC